jgi:hypothetical protein
MSKQFLKINYYDKPGTSGHAYYPSNSGGRDQEHNSLKPALANSLGDPISKIPNTKQ